MVRKVASIKGVFLAAALFSATVFVSGCADGAVPAGSKYPAPAPITGVDELVTNGDYLNKLRTLQPSQKKVAFIFIRARVEGNFAMVAEANWQSGVSPKHRTNAMKLMAVQAGTLKMVAEAADWPEMAELYGETFETAQAMVRGELSKEEIGSAAESTRSRTKEQMSAFTAAEADTPVTSDLKYFVERFASHLIATTKAYAWDIDTSRL